MDGPHFGEAAPTRPTVSGFSVRTRRHARWVERYSAHVSLHDLLFTIVLRPGEVEALVSRLADELAVSVPEVRTHRRRRIDTGACEPARRVLVDRHGAARVSRAEARRGRPFPLVGSIRVGVPTLAGVVAHEFGHHLVHELERAGTPAHGRIWVLRYDAAAVTLHRLLGSGDPTARVSS